MNRRARGSRFERRAEHYLRGQGLETLDRNFHCRQGEVDLVMREDGVTVFVEVRYRGTGSLVTAAQSVDRQKQAKLCRAAGVYLNRHPRLAATPCRFDVVAFRDVAGQAEVRWIRNAFSAGGG